MSQVNANPPAVNTTTPPVVNVHLDQGPQKVNNIIVFNDQSTFKGLVWSLCAMNFGGATLGAFGATMFSAPLDSAPTAGIPYPIVPFALGVTTVALGTITKSCFNNACYHLGSRQMKVIHTY